MAEMLPEHSAFVENDPDLDAVEATATTPVAILPAAEKTLDAEESARNVLQTFMRFVIDTENIVDDSYDFDSKTAYMVLRKNTELKKVYEFLSGRRLLKTLDEVANEFAFIPEARDEMFGEKIQLDDGEALKYAYYCVCLLTNTSDFAQALIVENSLIETQKSVERDLYTPLTTPLTSPYEFSSFLKKIIPKLLLPLIFALQDPLSNWKHITTILASFLSSAPSAFYHTISQSKQISQDVVKCLVLRTSLTHDLMIDVLCPSHSTVNETDAQTLKDVLWKLTKNLSKPEFSLFLYLSETLQENLPIAQLDVLYMLTVNLVEKLCFEKTHGSILLGGFSRCTSLHERLLSDILDTDVGSQTRRALRPESRQLCLDILVKCITLANSSELPDSYFSGANARMQMQPEIRNERKKENLLFQLRAAFLGSILRSGYKIILDKLCVWLDKCSTNHRLTSAAVDLSKVFCFLYQFKCLEGDVFDEGITEETVVAIGVKESAVLKHLERIFLQFPESAIFHHIFVDLFKFGVMNPNDSEFCKIVLQKHKLLKSLVVEYEKLLIGDEHESSKTSSILILLNVLRLKNDSLPKSSYLKQFLQGHQIFRSFLPKLVELTIEKFIPARTQKEREQLAAIVHAKESKFAFVTDAQFLHETFLDDGVELGSKFAASLGFDGVMKSEDTENTISSNASASEPKPKKKKKKKKKN